MSGFRNVAYFCTNNGTNIADVGCFQVEGGGPFFDVACIFAANMNGTDPNQATLWFNESVTTVLTQNIDQIQSLQQQGVKVLLSVLNNWEAAGWSNFTTWAGAQAFAGQCADAVEKYGLDGIDIDDEYSSGTPNDTSLIMATYALQQAMPGKIVSKALFDDTTYFGQTWEGHTLAQNLTYGWEMSYFSSAYGDRLAPYVDAGMALGDLGLGVTADGGTDGSQAAAYVRENAVGGVMVYDVTSGKTSFLEGVAQGLGESLQVPPDCFR